MKYVVTYHVVTPIMGDVRKRKFEVEAETPRRSQEHRFTGGAVPVLQRVRIQGPKEADCREVCIKIHFPEIYKDSGPTESLTMCGLKIKRKINDRAQEN
jgi:hypothetical protein